MMAKALEQRWPISDELRQQMIERLGNIVTNEASSPREVTAAAKALMAADKVNVDSEVADKMPDKSEPDADERYERIAAALARLNSRSPSRN